MTHDRQVWPGPPGRPPLEIVAEAALDAATAAHSANGWTVARGLAAIEPALSPHPLYVGVARNRTDGEAALLAAALGNGVVVALVFDDPFSEGLFVDQFARLGGCRRESYAVEAVIDPGVVPLLDRLAAGDSIEAAAEACHLSLRTANRRLAAARAHFGVATTIEAVLAQQRSRQR
jgi:hypothetical protein